MPVSLSSLTSLEAFKTFLHEYHKALHQQRSFPPLGAEKALHTAATVFGYNNSHAMRAALDRNRHEPDPTVQATSEGSPLEKDWPSAVVLMASLVPASDSPWRDNAHRTPEHAKAWGKQLFATGSASAIHAMCTALWTMPQRPGGSVDLWTARARTMFQAGLEALCALRDKGGAPLTTVDLKRLCSFSQFVEWSICTDLPAGIRDTLAQYLSHTPGFSAADMAAGKLSLRCQEQHTYLAAIMAEGISYLEDAGF